MEREEFEAAFSEFIGRPLYREQTEKALFSLARAAFSAGWCAARYPDEPAGQTDPPR